MPLGERLKQVGGILLGIVLMAVPFLLIALLVEGAGWVSLHVLPILNLLTTATFFICLICAVALAFTRKTRAILGVIIFGWSYLCGLNVWLFSLLVVLSLWGLFWCVVGLLFAGVGVVPLSLLAALFKGEWEAFFTILILGILTIVARIGGAWLAGVSD